MILPSDAPTASRLCCELPHNRVQGTFATVRTSRGFAVTVTANDSPTSTANSHLCFRVYMCEHSKNKYM